MPLTKYGHLIFPPVVTPYGVIELRVNTFGGTNYKPGFSKTGSALIENRSLTIGRQLILTESDFELDERINEEGASMAEQFSFVIKDEVVISGLDNFDDPVTQDFSAEKLSLIDFYFEDKSILYSFWATLIKPDGSREIFFAGDINPNEIERSHDYIHKSHTADEQRLATARITAKSWSLRLKSKAIQVIVDDMVEGDMTQPTNTAPFFNGIISQPGGIVQRYTEASGGGTITRGPRPGAELDNLVLGGTWDDNFDAAYYGHYGVTGNQFGSPENYDDTFPIGTWGIKITRVLKKICDACDYDFDEDTGVVSSFEYFVDEFNQTSDLYERVTIDETIISLCYNYVFGVSPYDGSEVSFPVSFDRKATLASLLQALCWFYGCRLTIAISQGSTYTAGYIELKLRPIREASGTLPGHWILREGSREDVIEIAKDVVVIKVKADDDQYICPAINTENATVVEIPFRFRRKGSTASPVWQHEDFSLNLKKSNANMWEHFKRSNWAEQNKLHSDGWVNGAFAFVHDGRTTNHYYPSNFTPYPLTVWGGYYALRGLTEKPGVYTNRDNGWFAYAQLYAREFLGNRRAVERNYYGVTDEDGGLLGVSVGFTSDWFLDGATRTFKSRELKRRLIENTSSVRYGEVPDYDDLEDLPVMKKGDGGTTGGGSGGSTGGGSEMETIITQGDGFKLPYKATYSASVPLFWLKQTNTGGVVKLELDYTGSSSAALDVSSNADAYTLTLNNTGTLGYGLSVQTVYGNSGDFTRHSGGAATVTPNVRARTLSGADIGPNMELSHGGASGNALTVINVDTGNTDAAATFGHSGLGRAVQIDGSVRIITFGINANYNVFAGDFLIANTAAVPLATVRNVTLPAAATNVDRFLIVKDESGQLGGAFGTMAVIPSGTDTIDGGAGGVPINAAYGMARLYSNGAAWFTW